MTRGRIAAQTLFAALSLGIHPAAALAASARSQLCRAAGQSGGCLQDVSVGGRPAGSDPGFAAMQTTYGLMQGLTQSTINDFMRPSANSSNLRRQNQAAALEMRKKKKLQRTAWLSGQLRDSPPRVQGAGRQPRAGGFIDNALEAVVQKVLKGYIVKPTGDPILDNQPKIHACVSSGECSVVGDPKFLGRLAYSQTGNTCDIATQVQVLKAAGRPIELKFEDGHIEKIDPTKVSGKDMENTLFRYAQEKGYFDGDRADGSTSADHTGRILADLGYTVEIEQHPFTGIPDIDKIPQALQKGHYVAVWVQGDALWRERATGMDHTVLVSGAVLQGGEVKGIYVNDTGTDKDAERAGFLVPADYFKTAWRKDHGILVEITPPSH